MPQPRRQRSTLKDAELQHTPPLGFRIWRLSSHRASMVRAHSHADIEVNFVTQGSLTYAYGGRIVTLISGDLGVFWGSVPHQTIEHADARGVWATFTLPMLLNWKLPQRMDERLLKGEFLKSALPAEQFGHERHAFERWADEVQGGAEARRTIELELEARMRRMALEAPPAPQAAHKLPPKPGIERALAFLHQNYRGPIDARAVAAAAGWHEKYLLRAFKRTLGMTLREYLLRLRIAHAQWLLIGSGDDMLRIAFESGFQSPAPFYQAFRNISGGLTPLQFRKQARRLK